MKTTRISLVLFALFLCLSTTGLAQSNAHPDYQHQHKDAEKYQKTLMKQRQKQEKAEARKAKAYRKQHQQ